MPLIDPNNLQPKGIDVDIEGAVAIVTGAGSGIGAALVAELVAGGARVVATDIDRESVERTASSVGGDAVWPLPGDASDTNDIRAAISVAEREFGPVDLYAANAGVLRGFEPAVEPVDWDVSWQVNVMAHVRAAELLLPGWLERGSGYFLSTASAAGLLTQLGSPTYSVTKHAAVGYAEWLAATYGDRGVGVSCLCPMGVDTAMIRDGLASEDPTVQAGTAAVTTAGEVLTPEVVAREAIRGVREGRFLVLPHPEVETYRQRKAADIERWIGGMQRYRRSLEEQ